MISIMIDHKLGKYLDVIQYSFDFLFGTLGYPYKYIDRLSDLSEDDILFFYSLLEPLEEEIKSISSNRIAFFSQAEIDLLIPGKLSKEDINNYLQELKLFSQVPVISKKKIENPVISRRVGSLYWGEFKFDLIGNLYFYLTNYGGLLTQKQSGFSTSFLFGYASFPFLNSLLWMVETFIKEAVNSYPITFLIKKEYWPNGEDYAYAVSHNIDSLHKWHLTKLATSLFTDLYLLVSFKWGGFYQNLKEKLSYLFTNYEVYWNFQEIQELLEKHKLRTTFFVGAAEADDPATEFDYSIDDRDLIDELNILVEKKNEIALLLKGNRSGKQLISSLQKFRNTLPYQPTGYRSIDSETNENLTKEETTDLNLLYSSTKSFGENSGFYNGIAFPYRELADDKPLGHWEIPTLFSDNTLIIDNHNTIPKDKAKDLIKNYLVNIQKTNGLLTFNFSMANFNDIRYSEQLLDFTLRLLSQGRGFTGTYRQIAEWWDKREQVLITETNDDIILTFPCNIDKMVISYQGNRRLKKLNTAKITVKENKTIVLNSIKEGDRFAIPAPRDEQIYVNSVDQKVEDDDD